MHDGELNIVAARPGMGKTAWMMSVAMHLAGLPSFAEFDGYIVAVFSLEMPREQLGMRMVGASSGLGVSRARTGKLGDDYGVWMQHTERVSRVSIIIDDTAAITLLEVRAKCRRIQRENPKRKLVVMLDYVQLMGEPDGCGSREEAVAQNSRGLKGLAKEMRVPAMALSQINRKVEERTDKRPQMSDLRESGAIEQDADVIQFIFRPEYHLKPHEVPELVKGQAEIITAKQRNGPPGTDYAAYRATATRFDDPTDADLERWEMFDEAAQQQSIAKRFAPGSRLPGAKP
jgi:replicative DNA helicase